MSCTKEWSDILCHVIGLKANGVLRYIICYWMRIPLPFLVPVTVRCKHSSSFRPVLWSSFVWHKLSLWLGPSEQGAKGRTLSVVARFDNLSTDSSIAFTCCLKDRKVSDCSICRNRYLFDLHWLHCLKQTSDITFVWTLLQRSLIASFEALTDKEEPGMTNLDDCFSTKLRGRMAWAS